MTALCVAFAIATLVAQNCDATSTDSQNINGTSDIRSIRDGSSDSGSNSRTREQSLSPSLNSNLVAANFSNVALPILSSNDVDGEALPAASLFYPELGAMGKEQALYVQQLEMNFAKLKRRVPIYQNEFAVHIPNGAEVADRIAHKYGFQNMGQVSSLPPNDETGVLVCRGDGIDKRGNRIRSAQRHMRGRGGRRNRRLTNQSIYYL